MLSFGRTEENLKKWNINLDEIEIVPLMSYRDYIESMYNSAMLISDCLHPDTYVTLSNGIIRKISEINVGDTIISNNGTEKIKIKENKSVDIKYKIKTKYNNIVCSENHKLFVNGKNNELIEKKVKDITINDRLASFCKINISPESVILEKFHQLIILK